MKIIKHSGETADYDRDKLRNSLKKAGAEDAVANTILQSIESGLYPGISTRRLHKMARQLLRKVSHAHAARYDLRPALAMLGPEGFFFEKFLSKVFEKQGLDARTNLILAGKCVAHEVDIALKGDGRITMVECKFHTRRDRKCDIKVPLYVLSRFNDLKPIAQTIFSNQDTFTDCLIATNTRFTSDAVLFASCSGLQLLGWDYPAGRGIKDLVDRGGLYPITCLTTLTASEKERLLVSGTVLVPELLSRIDVLEQIGISDLRKNNIAREANELCNGLS